MKHFAFTLAALFLFHTPCHAQVVTFDNSAGTFVWIPTLIDQSSGATIIQEKLLDISLSPADNQAGLADPFRALSYWFANPTVSNQIIVSRATRFFPDGRAGIDFGEFFNYGSDAGHYVRNYLPGESVIPDMATGAFPTNAGLANHSTTGQEAYLGQRIIIGVRFQADQVGKLHNYGYVILEWRENLQFPNTSGGTTTVDMYQPVEWAYEITPNVPITIPDTPDCPADTNGDGSLSPADFTAWLAAFNAGTPNCDQNADSLCTPADFTAWLANYNAGC